MEDTLESSRSRKKKACTECRQQKARCDASTKHPQPCSRCAKLGLECIISALFQREHKRQKLQRLEQETEELRRRLDESAQAPAAQIEIEASSTMAPANSGVKRDEVVQGLRANEERTADVPAGGGVAPQITAGQDALYPIASVALSSFSHSQLPALNPGSLHINTTNGRARIQALQPPVGLGPPTMSKKMELAMAGGEQGRTQPRTLGGVTLTGDEIDEIFNLFRRQYSHFLPVLDLRDCTPNTIYALSPFCFWSVIGTASRTSTKNPTIFPALAKHITQLAFTSILSGCGPWYVIIGLLLNLNWPLPKDVEGVDVVFPLSGHLLHVAMQYGLHHPLSAHEFYKTKHPLPSNSDIMRRSEFWAYTVIAYQRSCLMKGHPPRPFPEMTSDTQERKMLYQSMSSRVRIELKAQELVTRCSAAVTEYGVKVMTVEQERGLDLILDGYEHHIRDLHVDAPTAMDRFHVQVANMSVQQMHFFKTHTLYSDNRLNKVAAAACDIIDAIKSMSGEFQSLAVCPIQVVYGLLSAGVALLRILKGPETHVVDNIKVRDHFMTALNLTKQLIVTASDMPTKIFNMLSQLYGSTKVFRKADGTIKMALLIRSRSFVSSIIDAMWWWKDEFEPPMGEEEDDDEAGPGMYDDMFWTDMEWAIAQEAIMTE